MDDAAARPPGAVPESREVAAHRARREAPQQSEPTAGTLIIAVVAIVLVLVVGWAVIDGFALSDARDLTVHDQESAVPTDSDPDAVP